MKKKTSKPKPRSQKEYGVFYTPSALADKMVEESLSQLLNIRFNHFQNLIQQRDTTPIGANGNLTLQELV